MRKISIFAGEHLGYATDQAEDPTVIDCCGCVFVGGKIEPYSAAELYDAYLK